MTDENLSVEYCFDSDADHLLLNAVDALRGHPITLDLPNATKKRPPMAEWRYWQNGEVTAAFTGGLALLITHMGDQKYHAYAVKSAGAPLVILRPFMRLAA